jgi:hypothetical protein
VYIFEHNPEIIIHNLLINILLNHDIYLYLSDKQIKIISVTLINSTFIYNKMCNKINEDCLFFTISSLSHISNSMNLNLEDTCEKQSDIS